MRLDILKEPKKNRGEAVYYRSKGKSVCADVVPYYEDGEFKLFYLRDYRDVKNDGEGCPWCLLTTGDLVHYVDNGPTILRGKQSEQDLYVFTGCTVKFNGEYYVFYTGHNPHLRRQGLPEQKILMAKGDSLTNLRKVPEFVFEAPEWLEMHDFRDPFVFFDDAENKYCMLIAGRLKSDSPTDVKGVTLIAYSDDLFNWEVSREPFYAPSAFFTHECPDLFKMGDYWYLVFSEFTDRICTTYRMSKSLKGPWRTPKVNSFDGHAFYAAKSAFDGKRRIMFGWNCIKNNERDDEFWQWGGTIIPHELVQDEDGTLYVKCPDEVAASFDKEVKLERGLTFGAVDGNEYAVSVGENGIKSAVMFGETPQNFKIELEFETTDDIGDFGVILRESDNLSRRYEVRFEPRFNRLCFDKFPRKDNTVHVNVDVERYCPLKPGEKNKMIIIAEESVLEVYVNDKVAMSARMFDFKKGNFGLYTKDTKVKFGNVKLFTR